MSEEIIEGGISTTSKCVKWKLKNFAQIFKYDSLVRRQIAHFDVTDSRGVTSRWVACLYFQTLPAKENATDTEPQTYLGLCVKFNSATSGTVSKSSVCAKVTTEIEGKEGESIFKGCHANYCEFNEERKTISWAVPTLKKTMDISHLLMADGSMIIKIDMLIFDSGLDVISDKYHDDDMAWKRKGKIYRGISSIENDETNSDVKIVSKDGREFFAYRWILRGASDVFDVMFRVNMRENETGVVKLDDLSGNAVKVLLHYIYTGEMAEEWKTPGVVEEVVYAADKFQIQEMKFYLNIKLGKVCRVENAAALLRLANQTGLKCAAAEILKFIQKNIRNCESFFSVFNNVSTAAVVDSPTSSPSPKRRRSD